MRFSFCWWRWPGLGNCSGIGTNPFKEHQAAEKAAAEHAQSLQNLPGLPYELLPSLQAAQRQGPKAMRAWLKAYGASVQDPRKAWIELDYCGLIFRDDPNEARRVFADVKKRTPPSSPVWPRVQELRKDLRIRSGERVCAGQVPVRPLFCFCVQQNVPSLMDIIFNCPKCQQELEVDSGGAGSEIDCPSCGEKIVIPQLGANGTRASGSDTSGRIPVVLSGPANPIATSAAAKIEMHLKVPVHDKPAASLITKPLPPLEATAKETDKKIRVRSIRHTDCIEVGHDKFDEVLTAFLIKVGEENIISISPLTYTHLDIGSQKLMTEYAVLIVYRG